MLRHCAAFVKILLSVMLVKLSVSEESKYQIFAPEYICTKDSVSQTTIRINGDDFENLNFNWSVTFKLTDSHNQRHVLMTWRSVRELEKLLNNLTSDELTRGFIFIKNEMLTPGVKYLFNVNVQDKENDTIVDSEEFCVEYVDNESSSGSIMLFGPNVIYVDMIYTATAVITTCSREMTYQISWQILDRREKILHKETTKSRILQLAPGTLKAGNTYGIQCILSPSKSDSNTTSAIIWVKVLFRRMELDLYPFNLQVSMNQQVFVKAFFNNSGLTESDVMIEWTCMNADNENCIGFEEGNFTEMSLPVAFEETGSYLINLKVTKTEQIMNANCTIVVVEEMLPVIELENAMTVCTSSADCKISARVKELTSGCTLQWTCQQVDGYHYIDLNIAPGMIGSLYNVTTNAEEFADDGNDTYEKKFDLVIPPRDDDIWEGLEGNSKYLFRITACCEINMEQSNDTNTTNQYNNQSTCSFAEVVVKVLALPILKEVEIFPESGEALRTLYTIKTEPETSNQPVLYKFGFLNKLNKYVFLSNQYDILNTFTMLPFTGEPVQIILEVCDNRDLCNLTFGPKVIVKPPENFTFAEAKLTDKATIAVIIKTDMRAMTAIVSKFELTKTLRVRQHVNALINNINKSMFEQDYSSAFIMSTMLLQTTSEMASDYIFNKSQSDIMRMIKTEINSFIKSTDDDKSVTQALGNFLRFISILDDEFNLDEDVVENMLVLRDKLSEKAQHSGNKQLKPEKFHNAPTRKLLSIETTKKPSRIVSDTNLDEIKHYLEITELAIKRLNNYERVEREKTQLREKLNYFMPSICQFLYNHYKTDERIGNYVHYQLITIRRNIVGYVTETSSLVLNVEKLELTRKYNEIIYIPYKIHGEEIVTAKIMFGREVAEKYYRENNLCVGKVLFVDDYFHNDHYVHDIKILSANEEQHLQVGKLNGFSIFLDIPLQSNDTDLQCAIWENEQWYTTFCKTLQISNHRIKCGCKSLGYFSIISTKHTITVNKSIAKTTDVISQSESAKTGTTENDEVSVSTVTTELSAKETSKNKPTFTTALILLVAMLSFGILSILFAFGIMTKRYKRYTAVQNIPHYQYAKYFEE